MRVILILTLLVAPAIAIQKKMPKEQPRTPTSIGEIRVSIKQPVIGAPTAVLSVDVLDVTGGKVAEFNDNLFDYLTPAQESQVKALLTAIRAKADAELK